MSPCIRHLLSGPPARSRARREAAFPPTGARAAHPPARGRDHGAGRGDSDRGRPTHSLAGTAERPARARGPRSAHPLTRGRDPVKLALLGSRDGPPTHSRARRDKRCRRSVVPRPTHSLAGATSLPSGPMAITGGLPTHSRARPRRRPSSGTSSPAHPLTRGHDEPEPGARVGDGRPTHSLAGTTLHAVDTYVE